MKYENRLTVSSRIADSNNESLEKADPNFLLNYAKLFEEKENGTAEKFTFQNKYGRIDYIFIKREIPTLINGRQYYDITTPYGYGGPMVIFSENEEELLNDYFSSFHEYCLNHNIVSEFIRFHLFESNRVRENFYGEVCEVGAHVVKPLDMPLRVNMAADVNRSLNKARKLGISIRFDTTGAYLKEFLNMYNDTMKRNEASEYYSFDQSFFEQLHSELHGQFVYGFAEYKGKIISSRLTLYGEKYGFGFLGGTLKDYFHTHATTVVDYSILNYLQEKQCSYFSFGGGFRDKDGIYKYKRKFNKNGDCPFYIGKKIHFPEVYDELVYTYCDLRAHESYSSYFPLYRVQT